MERVRNLADTPRGEYLAMEQGRRAVVIALVAEVADTYLVGCEIGERIGLMQRTIPMRQQSAHIA